MGTKGVNTRDARESVISYLVKLYPCCSRDGPPTKPNGIMEVETWLWVPLLVGLWSSLDLVLNYVGPRLGNEDGGLWHLLVKHPLHGILIMKRLIALKYCYEQHCNNFKMFSSQVQKQQVQLRLCTNKREHLQELQHRDGSRQSFNSSLIHLK